MALLGKAAMLLSFDVVPEAVAEHDDWHSREHLPERLSIPGFLRGTRWTAQDAQPRYFVMYEVESLDTLTSAAYLERLNKPTPWTTQMMKHYRGMRRGFCTATRSIGSGVAGAALFLRFEPDAAHAPALPDPGSTQGLTGAHAFESAATPPATNEQRLRGGDAPFGSALLLTGYDAGRLQAMLDTGLAAARDASAGGGLYRLAQSLSARDAAGDGGTGMEVARPR